MIEVREIKEGDGKEWNYLIAIDKKTSVGYYTFEEAREIKRRLNKLIPDDVVKA